MGGNVPLGLRTRASSHSSSTLRGGDRAPHLRSLWWSSGCVAPGQGGSRPLGLSTKRSATAGGIERGGNPSRAEISTTWLSNPIYTGEIAHKGQLYPTASGR